MGGSRIVNGSACRSWPPRTPPRSRLRWPPAGWRTRRRDRVHENKVGRMDDHALGELAGRIVGVPGVVAVVLGGSRARGTHRPDSDYDLGLYYERGKLDVAALDRLACEVGQPATVGGLRTGVTAPGGWGPW